MKLQLLDDIRLGNACLLLFHISLRKKYLSQETQITFEFRFDQLCCSLHREASYCLLSRNRFLFRMKMVQKPLSKISLILSSIAGMDLCAVWYRNSRVYNRQKPSVFNDKISSASLLSDGK
jgi:hypothetical protein